MSPDAPTNAEAAVLADLEWVRRLARQLLGDASLADDVAQDAWLAARSQPPVTRDQHGGLRGWLATVVRNRVRRLLRTDRRRTARELAATNSAASEDPADVVARAALHQEVTAAVQTLDEPYRSALLWRYLDELPATEIARRQGIGHDAARQRISRGLAQLRERLDRTHVGGFAAWCAAWRSQLAPTATSSSLVLPALVVMLMNKWLLAVVAVALAVFFAWPRSPVVAPAAAGARDAGSVVAARSDAEATTPPAARESVANAAADALSLDVVDDAGRACVGVHVLALRDGALRAKALTDAAGRATFAATTDNDEWLLAQSGVVPVRLPRRSDASILRAVFGAGAVVQGEVRAAGGAGLSLQLEHDVAAASCAGLHDAARSVLAELGTTATSLSLAIDREHRFQARGLPADWTGALFAPPGWSLREPSRLAAVDRGTALLLRSPLGGLVLELTSPRLVRGRVLANGAPAAGFVVQASGSDDAPGAPLPSSRCDADGRFEVGVLDLHPERAFTGMLVVATEAGQSLLRVPMQANAGKEPIDVGELVLGAPLTVTVLGVDGQPLAEAEVGVDAGAAAWLTAMTGTDGRVRFAALPTTANGLVVSAAGHARVRRELPSDGACTVQLAAANEIEVRVVDTNGAPVGGGSLRVRADRLPYRAAAAGDAAMKLFRNDLPLDRDGRHRLVDLEPGVMLQLAFVDNLGKVVAEREVATPPLLRRDAVVLVAPASTFALAGVVRDENGRPVARARIHVEADGAAWQGRTDADGRFRVGPLPPAARTAHVEFQHPGFVAWVRTGMELAPDRPPLEITLERCRRVQVRVLQASGAPLANGTLLAELAGGGGALGVRLAPGEFELDRMPCRTGRVYVTLGGREFAAPIDAAGTFVELRVPDLGSWSVQLAEGRTPVRGERLCVAIAPAGATEFDRTYFLAGQSRLAAAVPPGSYRLLLERRRQGRREAEVLAERTIEIVVGADVALVLP